LGARAALVKGGSPAAGALTGDTQDQEAIDILYDGHNFYEFRASRVTIGRVHGRDAHFPPLSKRRSREEDLLKVRSMRRNGT
jgi:hydroxymethylpyrimidine/phosphomethylpyrimidine kinase